MTHFVETRLGGITLAVVLVLGSLIVACDGSVSPTAPQAPSTSAPPEKGLLSEPATPGLEEGDKSPIEKGKEKRNDSDSDSDSDFAKVAVCHQKGRGNHQLVSVSPSAVAGHQRHGDWLVTPEVCDGVDNDCNGVVDDSGPCCVETTVRDEFAATSFANDDGPDSWASPWNEDDPEAGGAGPGAGQVQVLSGELRLDDEPDTGGEPAAARSVDLSGASGATLTFDYRTSSDVDPADAVVVEVAADGASFTVLETFAGSSSGSRSFDISSFAANGTTVRFRVARRYGAADEFYFADNVEIRSGSCAGGN